MTFENYDNQNENKKVNYDKYVEKKKKKQENIKVILNGFLWAIKIIINVQNFII